MDVHEKFLTLEKMKKNNWVVEVQNTRKVKPKKVVDVSVRMSFVFVLDYQVGKHVCFPSP